MAKLIDVIKYGHERYVVFEDSQGETELRIWAQPRDFVGIGMGNSKKEAILSLVRNLRKEADLIEELIEELVNRD